MTQEDKAKRYDEVIKRAKSLYDYDQPISAGNVIINNIFPELKESESEDEKIRKALIYHYQGDGCICTNEYRIDYKDIRAWLEKQGEQKPQGKSALEAVKEEKADNQNCIKSYAQEHIGDKIEPKFKVGEWTVSNLDKRARQISEVHFDEYNSYYVVDGKSVNLEEYDRLHHLWTIQDAKDGDVLSDGITIFIFKDLLSDGSVMSYCDYDTDSGESDAFCPLSMNLVCSKITPATKEQCDLLFAKMKEAGYEWDSEKMNVKKIDLSNNKKFKVGDWLCCDATNNKPRMIKRITDVGYELSDNDFVGFAYETELYRWTMQDAKPGDILTDDTIIVIFEEFEKPAYREHIIAYIGIDACGDLQVTDGSWKLSKNVHPATKEQRNLLFKKMKENGYEWDAEQLVLKKIYQDNTNWSKDDEYMLQDIINGLKSAEHLIYTEDEYGKTQIQSRMDWLNSIKDKVEHNKQNQNWSDHDALMLVTK